MRQGWCNAAKTVIETPYPCNGTRETELSGYKGLDLEERQGNAASAKKAMLERFRAASEGPDAAKRRAERATLNKARLTRAAEREAAKARRKAELAAQAARDVEFAAQAQRDAEQAEARIAAEKAERAVALETEQKAARDARYAARKAAKKVRRRGY